MQEKPPVIEVTKYSSDDASPERPVVQPPLRLKVTSTLLVCLMGFATYYNQGVLGAIKTPLKKLLHINNVEFSLILCTSDLSIALLMPFSGLIIDYLGGACALVIASSVGVVGSTIVSAAVQVRNYKLMVFGTGILAIGNIANSTARYRLFSAWFPPNHGFALTLAFELAASKVGLLVSKALANVIADGTGDLAWTFWVATLADVMVLVLAVLSLFFVRACRRKYHVFSDPVTGETLMEKTGRFEPKRIRELPWSLWCIITFHVFQTTVLLTFSQNLTEIIEDRFNKSPKAAGWIAGIVTGGNFVILPLFGAFIDHGGHRLSVMAFIGLCMTIAMAIIRSESTKAATGAALGLTSLAICPTFLVAYDGVRSSLWHQEVYGTANAIKVATGQSVTLIIRVAIGVLQDKNHGKYDSVITVYLVFAIGAFLTAMAMIGGSLLTIDLARFQWTKRQRAARGEMIAARTKLEDEKLAVGHSRFNFVACSFAFAIFLGSVAAYIYACHRA